MSKELIYCVYVLFVILTTVCLVFKLPFLFMFSFAMLIVLLVKLSNINNELINAYQDNMKKLTKNLLVQIVNI
jgi:hypothetical protein